MKLAELMTKTVNRYLAIFTSVITLIVTLLAYGGELFIFAAVLLAWSWVLGNPDGARATLALNLIALCIACVIAVEGHILDREVLSLHLRFPGSPPNAVDLLPMNILWLCVPVTVMFLIGKKGFSIIFVILHLALWAQLTHELWRVRTGNPLNYPTFTSVGAYRWIFLVVSVICLIVYLAIRSILIIANMIKGGQEHRW